MHDPCLIFVPARVVHGLTNAVWASMKQRKRKKLAWTAKKAANRWIFPKVKVDAGPSSIAGGHGRLIGGGIWSTFVLALLVGVVWGAISVGAVFAPVDLAELKKAVDSCVPGISDDGSDCASSSYGAIEDWDVSRVKSLKVLFHNKRSFNQDLSKWVVSNITSLYQTITPYIPTSRQDPKEQIIHRERKFSHENEDGKAKEALFASFENEDETTGTVWEGHNQGNF